MSDEGRIERAADAIKAVAESVPVYKDAIQPGAIEIGKTFETVAKTVNAALTPLRLLVWGFDQIEEFLMDRLSYKLKDTPKERIITPDLRIAGPAVESLKFAGYVEEIREMYATLLATSMDADRADTAHPAFVEMVRQLTPDDARVLNHMATEISEGRDAFPVAEIVQVRQEIRGLDGEEKEGFRTVIRNLTLLEERSGCRASYRNPQIDLAGTIFAYHNPQIVDNLERLGIVNISFNKNLNFKAYVELRVRYSNLLATFPGGFEYGFRPGVISMTSFGRQFVYACVSSESGQELG